MTLPTSVRLRAAFDAQRLEVVEQGGHGRLLVGELLAGRKADILVQRFAQRAHRHAELVGQGDDWIVSRVRRRCNDDLIQLGDVAAGKRTIDQLLALGERGWTDQGLGTATVLAAVGFFVLGGGAGFGRAEIAKSWFDEAGTDGLIALSGAGAGTGFQRHELGV